MIHFPFETNGKLIVLGVRVLTYFEGSLTCQFSVKFSSLALFLKSYKW